MKIGSLLCYPLNESCAIDWNAWSAVGTMFAAVVALGIALHEGMRRRGEKKEAARGLTLLLLDPLRDWSERLKRLRNDITKEHHLAIYESFDEEGGDALSPPSELIRLMDRISELGAAAVPLSHGIHAARQARKMECQVQDVLRGNFLDASQEDEIMSRFRSAVTGAEFEISNGVDLMKALLERSK